MPRRAIPAQKRNTAEVEHFKNTGDFQLIRD
jgi:hypothetical protein